MATAVKNNPETSVPSLFDRAAAVSLVGVVYVVGCFGIVFKLLPYVFWDVLQIPEINATKIIVAVLIVAAATALLVVGVRLLGTRAPHGARAGIFVGVLGVLLILLLTRWASLWLEYWVYYDNYFSPTVGAALTAVVGLALLGAAVYYFLHPKCERYLILLEDQGWFSVSRFKPLQGVRVRRGTVIGIALIVGAGLYTLESHKLLTRLSTNWELNIPFTAKTNINLVGLFGSDDRVKEIEKSQKVSHEAAVVKFVQEAGKNDTDGVGLDANTFMAKRLRDKFNVTGPTIVTDPTGLRDFNNGLSEYVKIDSTGDVDVDDHLNMSTVEKKSKVKEISDKLAAENLRVPRTSPVAPIYGTETFATIQLLPLVQYTVLFILAALAGWMAWRIVNYPAFADFLIATEAEMNKVSWTSRRNLIKDTIVVLVTVFLMSVYLFAMDQAWSQLLSLRRIGILQIQPEKPDAKSADNKPW
jgi:preprotein translocase SecE subunit